MGFTNQGSGLSSNPMESYGFHEILTIKSHHIQNLMFRGRLFRGETSKVYLTLWRGVISPMLTLPKNLMGVKMTFHLFNGHKLGGPSN